MQLKQLKLAGFKSFVDPTIVPFSSQLVAVVGPNGCGKSNIIDAVRWVLGESSAKNLRGESMIDVIFNGSSQRKAVGQASVELIFDNSLGRIGGQFASYQEISLKRVVTRDGESTYYLNGSRCRRRDITDLFLGTGAGTKGYSIIGQGTISRLIEAKPEELRAYLEEAAGTSKYKERRRETLLRIEHTRENLARVADIQEELTKQLHRLERQAKAAEEYKSLKSTERLYKAEILALKWQHLTHEQQTKQKEIQQLTAEYEASEVRTANYYKEHALLTDQFNEVSELLQKNQGFYYSLATEIARLEEAIQQQHREKQRLEEDKQQIQNDWQEIQSLLLQDAEVLAESKGILGEIETALKSRQIEQLELEQALQAMQEQFFNWTKKINETQAALNKADNDARIEALQIQHLDERRGQMMNRLENITTELDTLQLHSFEQEIKEQKFNQKHLEEGVQFAEREHQQISQVVDSLRHQWTNAKAKIEQLQEEIYQLTSQQATLAAFLKTALEPINASYAHEWVDVPHLLEIFKVEEDWQFACELVLAEGLQAKVIGNLSELFAETIAENNAISFLTETQQMTAVGRYPRLADKVKGFQPNWLHRLDKIYAANSLAEAISWLNALEKDESIITKDGHWLGEGWIKYASTASQEEVGLLQRQEELTTVSASLTLSKEKLELAKQQYTDLEQQLQAQIAALSASKEAIFSSREALRACNADIQQKQLAQQHAFTRSILLSEEREVLLQQVEELAEQKNRAQETLCFAKEAKEKMTQGYQFFVNTGKENEANLQKCKGQVEEVRAACYQMQLKIKSEQLKQHQLNERIAGEKQRAEMLAERLINITQRLTGLENPAEATAVLLGEKINQHRQYEEQLIQQKSVLDQLKAALNQIEAQIKLQQKISQQMQINIQEKKMEEQALAVRAGSLLEALEEFERTVEILLGNIASETTITMLEQNLLRLEEKIKRLGAINLAAIEEYETESKRKQLLDEQYQDLMDALSTLESAIEKMDKETRLRLEATFNEVNTAFQSLFPQLFGGGRAKLELTCDNLLEAGIIVMAQPPGKRNATIHLLSGGEKAMTAVALVFAIFQLNPSPFCMLDEVDAPLDDVNVNRFCDLVKKMSKVVQFLFITHNKITMELADHLIGVTMREPGVSRIVAVNVEEALAMSEA